MVSDQSVLSIALVLFALLIWRGTIASRGLAVFCGLALGASVLLLAVFEFADRLSGNGIDASVLFHLGTGLDGAGLGDFDGMILAAIVTLAGVALLIWATVRLSQIDERDDPNGIAVGMGMAAVALSFFVNPAVADLSTLAAERPDDQAVFEGAPQEYAVIDSVTINGVPKNIVYVFLESLERTYLDQSLFPGLMPRLAALETQAMSYTDVRQARGTSWTIAGMSAALCGTPLNGFVGNSMSRMEQFLPRATCIGDLLDPLGYELHYMGGASTEFAAKGNFFDTHGFDSVEGREQLLPSLADPTYLSAWGLYDDSLYDLATARFDRLSAARDPFALMMLTVDTHHPNGHMSRQCDGMVYGDGKNSSLNAVHCADLMLGRFIDHIRNSPAAENTILVVASDHLAMPNRATDLLEKGERRNLLMIFDDDVPTGQDARPASTLDVGATLLHLLGTGEERLGYGRSLLRERPTLMQSLPSLDDRIADDAGFLASLWAFPSLEDGLRMDLVAERLVLGDQAVGYPVLITVDDAHKVQSMQFEFFADHPLRTTVGWLAPDQRFLWVDQCLHTAAIAEPAGEDGFCAVFGRMNGERLGVLPLADDSVLAQADLVAQWDGTGGDGQVFDARVAALRAQPYVGAENMQVFRADDGLTGDILIRSAGFGQGNSAVVNLADDSATEIDRGLNLIGLNAHHPPVRLFHADTCGWGGTISRFPNLHSTLTEAIAANAPYFSGFAVVSEDSVICSDPPDLAAQFAGLPLTRWAEIDHRTPYLAIIDNRGVATEFTGDAETAISVHAQDFLSPDRGQHEQRQIDSLPRIGHAGGAIDGLRYTNSFDALDYNLPNFDVFELDFVWTSDDALVCLHDWEGNFTQAFGLPATGAVDLATFRGLAATARHRNCTLDDLVGWLAAHPGIRIVTDVKDRNPDALRKIATDYPAYRDRFIVQIYQPEEYLLARELGFSDVIWTLYMYRGGADGVLSWLPRMDLLGLAMPVVTAEGGLATAARQATGVLTWVHTINDQDEFARMQTLDVTEIMTDLLPVGGG